MTRSTVFRPVRSMTGQGRAARQHELGMIVVDVRTVNNRGFKCTLRTSDSLRGIDSRIEAFARTLIHRGSVSLSVGWKRSLAESAPRIDQDMLRSYVEQLQAGRASFGSADSTTIDLAQIAALPGVIVLGQEDQSENRALWQAVEQTVREAIENLGAMREQEGAHMVATLKAECDGIRDRVDRIATLAPQSSLQYQIRLEEKIKRLLAKHEIEVSTIDLLREVQIYADRADVNEEITRLSSHLQMILRVFAGGAEPQSSDAHEPQPVGKKLEFIIQEMLRETNTIGSKAADAAISAEVVEIKCAIERMRELVLNLE